MHNESDEGGLIHIISSSTKILANLKYILLRMRNRFRLSHLFPRTHPIQEFPAGASAINTQRPHHTHCAAHTAKLTLVISTTISSIRYSRVAAHPLFHDENRLFHSRPVLDGASTAVRHIRTALTVVWRHEHLWYSFCRYLASNIVCSMYDLIKCCNHMIYLSAQAHTWQVSIDKDYYSTTIRSCPFP